MNSREFLVVELLALSPQRKNFANMNHSLWQIRANFKRNGDSKII